MTHYKVRYTQSSENDLDGIFRYIARVLCEPAIAANLLDEIDREIGKLETMPERYPLIGVPELRDSGYRKMLLHKDYLVIYTIDETEHIVYIERVISARRDWVRLLLV